MPIPPSDGKPVHGKARWYEKRQCWPACFPCYEAARKYRARVVYRRDTGRQQYRAPGGPVRAKVLYLHNKRGFSYVDIARGTGLSASSVYRLARNKPKYIMSNANDAINRFFEDNMRETGVKQEGLVPVRVTQLAVRGLMAQYWSQHWIASQVKVSNDTLSAIAVGRRKYVKTETEKEVLDLVRRVGSSTGTSVHAGSYAARRGWKNTLYYDELV